MHNVKATYKTLQMVKIVNNIVLSFCPYAIHLIVNPQAVFSN